MSEPRQDAIRLLRHLAFADEGVAAEANATADALEDGAGRAERDAWQMLTDAMSVQDDGLDVDVLANALRIVGLQQHRGFGRYAELVAAEYDRLRAAPPPHDPQEPER